jgi:phenylacetic acid degradation operon negative regulatory protein
MDMKLPITDEFLLDLYNFIEKIDETFDLFAPRTMKEVWYSNLYKLRRNYERKEAKSQFRQFLHYLKRQGYIKIKNLEQKQGIILTKKGANKVLKIKLKMKKRRKRTDGKWQMVIFDIPEKKRDLRNLFRQNLQILGYKMLQKSIWVCPYDVLKETEGIIGKYSLDPYVKLFLIEEIEV